MYKNGTILSDVLNLANSYPGFLIPNEKILLKSFPHWELNRIKSDEKKETTQRWNRTKKGSRIK